MVNILYDLQLLFRKKHSNLYLRLCRNEWLGKSFIFLTLISLNFLSTNSFWQIEKWKKLMENIISYSCKTRSEGTQHCRIFRYSSRHRSGLVHTSFLQQTFGTLQNEFESCNRYQNWWWLIILTAPSVKMRKTFNRERKKDPVYFFFFIVASCRQWLFTSDKSCINVLF